MYEHDRKRRLPAVHRGKRVPNLYTRPKRSDDTRYGDTFEVLFRDESGKQRQKTLNARPFSEQSRRRSSTGPCFGGARYYLLQRSKSRRLPPEYFEVLDGLVKSGERSPKTVKLYGSQYRKH